MSQSMSHGCGTSTDLVFAESLSKVSLTQTRQLQQDTSVLPSLAQIVFGLTSSAVAPVNDEIVHSITLTDEKADACLNDSPKRQLPKDLTQQMALYNDEVSISNEKCLIDINLQSISSLPLRTLMVVNSQIKMYANQQRYWIDSINMDKKINLFSALLLAVFELKALSYEELQGQAQMTIFSLGEKQIMKYVVDLTEQISQAIELNKLNKECLWLELEQKIKDPNNQLLRRKFLSLRIVKKEQKIPLAQQSIQVLQKEERTQFHQKHQHNDDNLLDNSKLDHGENCAQFEAYSATNYAVSTSLVVEISKNTSEEDISISQKVEKQSQHPLNEIILDDQRLSLVSMEEKDLISGQKMSGLVFQKVEKDISNATEGYLTEIEISFDEMNKKNDNSEVFKNSCMIEFERSESMVDISSIM